MGKKIQKPEEKKNNVSKVIVVTSHTCEKCDLRCVLGQKYLDNFVAGRTYKGVACHKYS